MADPNRPYYQLAAAMLYRAYMDITHTDSSQGTSVHSREARASFRLWRLSALRWVRSDSNHFLSFRFCCELLGYNMNRVRSQLLALKPESNRERKMRNSRQAS